MSARDVDFEFERAYQRLFASSTSVGPQTSGADKSSERSPQWRAESPKLTRTVSNDSRSGRATASTPRVDRPKQPRNIDAGLLSLSRQASFSKARPHSMRQETPQSQPDRRQGHPRPQAFQSPLDALARHKSASDSKGKARAYTHYEERPIPTPKPERNVTTPAPISLSIPPQSNSIPYQESVTYYPYPTGQPLHQLPGQLANAGSGIASVPGHAVAWTQPIAPAASMPAIAYPGFSASVIFSQPQFFASPPQAVQSMATPMPSDPGPQQRTSQQTGPASTSHNEQKQRESATTPSDSRQPPLASFPSPSASSFSSPSSPSSSSSPRKMNLDGIKATGTRWNEEQAAHLGNEENVSHIFKEPAYLKVVQRRALQTQSRDPKQKKVPVDENGVPIIRKRGRPPRVRENLQPAVSEINATASTVPIKKEAVQSPHSHVEASSPHLERCLALPEHRTRPHFKETHTLFVHSERRLRWLARIAISQTDQRTSAVYRAERSAAERIEWSRWGVSVAADVFLPHSQPTPPNDTQATSDDLPASQIQSQSQPDPSGLFPRDKRRAYVALRKELHSANRTASSRICVPRLVRYLAKVSAAAQAMTWSRRRRAYLDRKHRAAKLAKYMLKSVRPTALDVRRMWSVWALAEHARDSSKIGNGGASVQQREKGKGRVAFAATPSLEDVQQGVIARSAQTEDERRTPAPALEVAPQGASADGADIKGETRIKREPESPSVERNQSVPTLGPTQMPRAQLKQEPDSDIIMTPALTSPHLPASRSPESAQVARSAASLNPANGDVGARKEAPLFLRRNFRVYRLIGMTDFPIS